MDNNKIGPASKRQEDFLLSDADITVYGGSAGCYGGAAEYLTSSGWKRFDQYEEGDDVAQYNHDTGCIEFVNPSEYIKLPCDKFYRMQARGLDFILTPEHRVPFFNDCGDKDKIRVITFDEVMRRHRKSKTKGWTGGIKTTYSSSSTGIDLTDDQIRLFVAVQADGSFKGSTTTRCYVTFSKHRKDERMRGILDRLGIEYSRDVSYAEKYKNKTQYQFKFQMPTRDKFYGGDWYKCSQRQLEVIMDEVGHWDGTFVENQRNKTIRYYSSHKCNADFIQFAAHSCGYNTSFVKDVREHREKTNDSYTVNCTLQGKGFRRFANKDGKCEITEVPSEDGFKYCFTVPTSFLLVRINNKVFISGNSGKSYVGLMTPLLYVDDPHFRGVIFRRTMPEITAGGGLWDTAQAMYKDFDPGVRFREKEKVAIFSSGAQLKFSHLEMEKDKYSHQGAQYGFVLFDEGTHFSETMIDYLRSRLRAPKSKYKTQMKITCNPDYDSFLRRWVDWYLDPNTGIPDPEKAGKIRYFVRQGEELHWADTREELEEVYGTGPESGIVSFVFQPATIYDNPPLMEADPTYVSRLKSLARVERDRLLHGSWYARPSEEGYWKKDWIEFVDRPPMKVKKRVRAWDLAGSIPSDTYPNPDWTAGVLMSVDQDNHYYVEDCVRFRKRFQGVFEEIVKCAREDGADVQIIIPADPGAAGKQYASQLIRDLADKGFHARVKTTNKNKVTRFAPFSAVSEAGFVSLVRGPWNDEYTDELEAFDGGRNKKDDMVDGTSDAYWALSQSVTLPDFTLPNFTQSNPFSIQY